MENLEMVESTQMVCQPNSFSYGNHSLFLSDHAFQRMIERGRCNTVEDVQARIVEMLALGYEGEIRRKKGSKKERGITHKDLVLHVRENTITTVKYNDQYFMTGAA